METPVLQLNAVTKGYGGAPVLGPIDFSVERGEFLTLLGPSGCGKTTTLQIIAGLAFPSSGSVVMDGRDITRLEPSQRGMGLVFQSYALFPHKTIFDNVAFGLRMRKVPAAEIAERVRRVLELVGLPNVEDRLPAQLSGGQRQRVAVARAVVIEPKILLLDEPLSNLDAVLRKHMRAELRELQQRLGITTLFVTHDQDEAFEMSDRVVLMRKGRIAQISSPEHMYDLPDSRFAAEFIGEANILTGRIVQQAGSALLVEVQGGRRFEAPANAALWRPQQEVDLLIRPEQLEIEAEGASSNGSGFEARVESRVFSGDMLNLTLATDDGLRLVCRKPSLARYRSLAVGSRVTVTADRCHLLERT